VAVLTQALTVKLLLGHGFRDLADVDIVIASVQIDRAIRAALDPVDPCGGAFDTKGAIIAQAGRILGGGARTIVKLPPADQAIGRLPLRPARPANQNNAFYMMMSS
jgi:hypothetical protein